MHPSEANSTLRLILASSSPRRRSLLESIGFRPVIVRPDVDETLPEGASAEESALALAEKKALAVHSGLPSSCIIAADTIVELDGILLGKPLDSEDAIRMLEELSGRMHQVHTGVSLIKTDSAGQVERSIGFCETTRVEFRRLYRDEIERYVSTGQPMDKAGAYGIQEDLGSVFVSRIEGDYFTVVGLPLARVYQGIRELAPELDLLRSTTLSGP